MGRARRDMDLFAGFVGVSLLFCRSSCLAEVKV